MTNDDSRQRDLQPFIIWVQVLTGKSLFEETMKSGYLAISLRALVEEAARRMENAGLYYGHGTDNAFDEAAWLVLHSLGLSPVEPVQDPDRQVPAEYVRAALTLIDMRIATRKPAAYLTGTAWFCGHAFYVDERVLVPRSPIAELIQASFSPWLTYAPRRILDLCTGSACIAIACAYAFPEAEIDASDISADALLVATENVHRHNMHSRVRLIESDLFCDIPIDQGNHQRYQLIVSNPPYVDVTDMANLPAEYRNEPTIGLAAGMDGLKVVDRILMSAANYLDENGLLVVEVGNSERVLQEKYPEVPFMWIDFEYGGQGVFALSGAQVMEYHSVFNKTGFSGG